MTFDALLHQGLPMLLAAAESPADAAEQLPGRGEMLPLLRWVVTIGIYVLSFGLVLCLLRVLRGPELADRVLAADLLSLHVVGLVVLLTIFVGDLVFFDAALVVSIIGFVATVGFAQYIHAVPACNDGNVDDPPDDRPSAATGEAEPSGEPA